VLVAVVELETTQAQTPQHSEALLVVAYSRVLVDEVLMLEDLVALVVLLEMLAVTDLEVTATEVVAVAGVLLAAMQLVAVLVVQVAQPLVALVTL
jgi:hypothetical protein